MPKSVTGVLVGTVGVLALLAFTPGPAASQPLATPLDRPAALRPLPDDDANADTGTGGEGEGGSPAGSPEPAPEAQAAPSDPQVADTTADTPAAGDGATFKGFDESLTIPTPPPDTVVTIATGHA